MRVRLYSLVCFLVIVIGVLEPIGLVLKNDTFRVLGRVSTASVLPLVFNKNLGIEFWANQYSFETTNAEGEREELKITSEVLQRLQGPHTRVAAYVVPVGLGTIIGEVLYSTPLRYGFCGDAPVAREFGYQEEIKTLTVNVTSRTPGSKDTWKLFVDCGKN